MNTKVEALENAPPGKIIADSRNIPVITVDSPVTRRRYVHCIDFPNSEEFFVSTDMADVLSHLDTLGITEVVILDGRHEIPETVTIASLSFVAAFL